MRERFSTTRKIIHRISKTASESIKNNRKCLLGRSFNAFVSYSCWGAKHRPWMDSWAPRLILSMSYYEGNSICLWVKYRGRLFVWWMRALANENPIPNFPWCNISTIKQMSKSHRDLICQHVWQTHNAYVAQSAVTFYARTIFPVIRRRSLFCSTCSKCNNVLCAEDSVRKIYNGNQYKMISLD